MFSVPRTPGPSLKEVRLEISVFVITVTSCLKKESVKVRLTGHPLKYCRLFFTILCGLADLEIGRGGPVWRLFIKHQRKIDEDL